jgi:3-oxoacid CoA-transferase subunit A
LRAGGAGIPAFYTPTGVGTPIAEGKPEAVFDGRRAILERGIVADLALVRAHRADGAGNLIYRGTSRNFNPLVATASHMTIVEAEEIIDGYFDPHDVMTPGIYVQRSSRSRMRPRTSRTERCARAPRPSARTRRRDHVDAR